MNKFQDVEQAAQQLENAMRAHQNALQNWATRPDNTAYAQGAASSFGQVALMQKRYHAAVIKALEALDT